MPIGESYSNLQTVPPLLYVQYTNINKKNAVIPHKYFSCFKGCSAFLVTWMTWIEILTTPPIPYMQLSNVYFKNYCNFPKSFFSCFKGCSTFLVTRLRISERAHKCKITPWKNIKAPPTQLDWHFLFAFELSFAIWFAIFVVGLSIWFILCPFHLWFEYWLSRFKYDRFIVSW